MLLATQAGCAGRQASFYLAGVQDMAQLEAEDPVEYWMGVSFNLERTCAPPVRNWDADMYNMYNVDTLQIFPLYQDTFPSDNWRPAEEPVERKIHREN